jgi:hypothetical protein
MQETQPLSQAPWGCATPEFSYFIILDIHWKM